MHAGANTEHAPMRVTSRGFFPNCNRAVKRKYDLIPSTCLARPDNALLKKNEDTILSHCTRSTNPENYTYSQHE